MGHKLTLDDLNTDIPSVLSMKEMFLGDDKKPECGLCIHFHHIKLFFLL